jgi:hypothetical protein
MAEEEPSIISPFDKLAKIFAGIYRYGMDDDTFVQDLGFPLFILRRLQTVY